MLARELDALSDDVTGTGLLRERVLSLDPAATTLTLHRVIGLPDCPFCAGPAPRPVGSGIAADTVTEVLTRLDGWVGPLAGVIPTLRLEHPLGTARTCGPLRPHAAPRSRTVIASYRSAGARASATRPPWCPRSVRRSNAIPPRCPTTPDHLVPRCELDGDVLAPRVPALHRQAVRPAWLSLRALGS